MLNGEHVGSPLFAILWYINTNGFYAELTLNLTRTKESADTKMHGLIPAP